MTKFTTQVAIIGAGPAGLLLGHILRKAGIDALIVERHDKAHVLGRVRAGVLERTTTSLLEELGLDERLHRQGMIHHGFNLAHDGQVTRIDLADLVGSYVTVYGQTEVTRDLIEAAPARGLDIIWNAADAVLENIESERPVVRFRNGDEECEVTARFIIGCDGFHGVARQAIPGEAAREYIRNYPFGWLGILADVPPCHEEVVYANHVNGFALASMRSPTRSRCYIQVPIGETIDRWSDERFWDEFAVRMGPELAATMTRGPSFEKSIAPLRSYVFEPMRYGSLFLAGDAAHIVPPTGAKGLNLAASDVTYLGRALVDYFIGKQSSGVEAYSALALARVWKAERFSWSLTKLLHRFPDDGPFEQKMQQAEMHYIANSRAAQMALAENYVGLPL